MQAYFVGHMRDIGLARPDAADQRQRLREVEMRRMRSETQRIDRQHLRTAQFFGLGVLDGLEVRQVGQRPDAEARDLEAFGMVARHGHDLHIADTERPCGVDFVQFDLRHAAVFVLREGIVEILAHALQRPRGGPDMDLVDGRRVIDEIESPHVVQTADMVLVLVSQQNGVEMPHARAEHLVAEIGSGVDDDAHAPRLDHRRGAQTVVAPVRRRAYLAAAADDGYALRSTGSQKGEFHGCKCRKNSAIPGTL